MAIKPGLSPKLEAMIGFDDCGKNLPFGAENLWIRVESIWLVVVDVCAEVRIVVKEKGYKDELISKLAQLLFPDNGARKLVGYFKRI